jgi:hypothetical protein
MAQEGLSLNPPRIMWDAKGNSSFLESYWHPSKDYKD